MILEKLSLQNFRSYPQNIFDFSSKLTIILGPNTAGKTNLIEAIYLLAVGESFKANTDKEMIEESKEFARVQGKIRDLDKPVDRVDLAILITLGSVNDQKTPYKRFLINSIGRRRTDFVRHFYAVLFHPQDIEIITNSPGRRRNFLDWSLSQGHQDYHLALVQYEKALRHRNKLLSQIQKESFKNNFYDRLEYWNELLIKNGELITERRRGLIAFLNRRKKIDFHIEYHQSEISKERLKNYAEKEFAAGYTLIGPQKDDFVVNLKDKDVSTYGSRGEQRLAVLWLKLGELDYLKEKTGEEPVLLLDDIFSEFDAQNRELVMRIIPNHQTIITTTDPHFIENFKKEIENLKIIELKTN